MACFASLIAPFGGFFASGVKRAFKIKDFGQSIPGHGGMTDRMDCQFLMGLFAYIYYQSFIKVLFHAWSKRIHTWNDPANTLVLDISPVSGKGVSYHYWLVICKWAAGAVGKSIDLLCQPRHIGCCSSRELQCWKIHLPNIMYYLHDAGGVPCTVYHISD